ncbi:Lrp/AsnC family transcriptional regulator [Crocinitomicaceae bacterium]|jgi:Lrp/AsnC family transcriptional regulator, leucine-responsive regulatory protein|nr:Lrp/AsnC family transcriptional regulator [Crocinitomicaceae bacterium]
MDAIDLKIIKLLQQDAKQNTKEIAKKVGLTVSPTYERIKKLEELGVIKKYIAIIDNEKVGQNIMVYCQISLTMHSRKLIDNFIDAINSYNEVLVCQHVSGNYDFLLKVGVEDMNAYQKFVIEKLSIIDGISNVQSLFVMNEIKNQQMIVV